MKRLLLALALVLGGVGVTNACGSDRPLPASDTVVMGNPDGSAGHGNLCSTPGHEGCPCSEAGAEVECGKVAARSGEYVTCSMGKSKCDGTTWGACTGNRIVAASLPGIGLGMGGLRPMSTPGPCTDPCDPYTCTTVTGSTTDVTDPGVVQTDAGLSIQIGTQPTGPTCYGLFCQRQKCSGVGVTTTISGTVYDPAQKNPLYNAYVYIPVDPAAALPAFTSGASCDTCAGAGTLTVVALAQTGADGKFKLDNVPVGTNIPLVVQMGKWRRKVTIPSISACVDNPLDKSLTHLPKNRFDGDNNTADIPLMAIATGNADPFECMLLKAGIDPAEIDVPSKNTRIQYYVMPGTTANNNKPGKDHAPGATTGFYAPLGTTLTNNLAKLKTYDVVILPCEGGQTDHNADAQNLVDYANAGGRVFTTHYGYSWLATPGRSSKTDFYKTANWAFGGSYDDPTGAVIDQTFPKGAAFAQWMQNVGATMTLGAPSIIQPRHDATSEITPTSQRWIYGWGQGTLTTSPSDMLLSMTFNTPTTAAPAAQCGRVVYSDFHVSTSALTSATSCKSNADCNGFTSTCNAVQGTCADLQCSGNNNCRTGFSCVGAAVTGTCVANSCTAPSDCDNNTCYGTHCGCTNNNQCGSNTCGGSCEAKACAVAGDCKSFETCSGLAGGNCQPKACTQNSNCGTGGVCTANKCQCNSNTPCGSGTCYQTGSCTAKTCYSASTCGASESCSGSAGTCGAKTCTTNAQCGTGNICFNGACTCSANNQCTSATCTPRAYGSCKAATCGTPGNVCGATETCSAGNCVPKTCAADADCSGGKCVGTKCQCAPATSGQCRSGTCNPVGDCAASACANGACASPQTCTGAVSGNCVAKTCTTDSQCGGGTCVTGKCTCGNTSASTDCGSGSCTSLTPGTCTAKTCTSAGAGCGTAEACSGNVATGSCVGKSCTQNSDCPNGQPCANGICECTANSQCGSSNSRLCANRGCIPTTCAYNGDCGTVETCSGGTPGICKKTCSTDADCPSAYCVGGLCTGCYSDADCGAWCNGGTAGTCSGAGTFPVSCKTGNLSGQEAALEFMLFDLTACVSPDSGQPPVPPVTLNPVTFTLDFTGMCGPTEKISWREVDWQATIPSTASIAFTAQTGDTVSDFSSARTAAVAKAMSTTPSGKWDIGLIPFSTQSPPITSKSMLRLTITLNPTSDKLNSPTLGQWRVLYDCSEST